jgi:hypothetical protein
MEGTRVITIVVELDSRRLGGSMMLLPFGIAGLSSNTCREMLKLVLIEHLDRPTALAIAEVIKMFCTKQEVMTESGIDARIEREIANAITCIEMYVMTVTTSFSTFSFTFKITSRPTATPSREIINPFIVMRQSQIGYVALLPRLNHVRMYASHVGYDMLIDFPEDNKLAWTTSSALTAGKCFVEGMSRAFIECNPSIWKALNGRHNTGA